MQYGMTALKQTKEEKEREKIEEKTNKTNFNLSDSELHWSKMLQEFSHALGPASRGLSYKDKGHPNDFL